MGRPKKGTAPGRVSDFKGEKAAWLSAFQPRLLDADDVGDVYTDATNQFLLRYGYDLAITDNVEGDPEENPPEINPPLDDEEQDRRDEIRVKLRTVGIYVYVCCASLTSDG
jgi:hypothetical protein